MKYNRIMFAGPSGFGKTTLAKWLSEKSGIPFESGSLSDLIPQTKEIPHKDMLSRDSTDLYMEDFKLLNLRNKLFAEKDQYISDRSYLDSGSYFLYKQASKLHSCEVEHFLSLCNMILTQQCDCLILLNFLPSLIGEWVTEDNKKRITSNYFQIEISSLMMVTLELIGYKKSFNIPYVKPNISSNDKFSILNILNKLVTHREYLQYGAEIGSIENLYGNTDVIIINEPNLQIRKDILETFVL